jgi:Kdo2-lipid IVA 3' secondary acyltransferase
VGFLSWTPQLHGHDAAVKIRFQHTGRAVAWLLRGIASTLRYEVEDRAGILRSTAVREPLIWAFWHNRMFLIPYVHERWFPHIPGCILSSPSGDGQIIADVCAAFGLEAARGSSSKPDKGMSALIRLAEKVKQGCDIGITPDGPRGPLYELHPGILKLAQLTGAAILPCHVEYDRCWEFGTWDRFQLPKPFTTAHFRLDEPFHVPRKLPEQEFEQARLALERQLQPRGAS